MSLSNFGWRGGRVRAAHLLAVGVVLGAGGLAAAAQEFKGLGVLPGGTGSMATGISADGSVVVGAATDSRSRQHAFRWTLADGMVDLGTFRDGRFTVATAVSADGAVIAGFGDLPGGIHAFRWTSDEGLQDLGSLPDVTVSQAFAISGNGKVIAGLSGRAFRWSEQSGMQSLGVLGNDFSSFATGANADGSVIVGASGTSNNDQAFISTVVGMRGLGFLAGGSISLARGVNADGSVVVGISDSSEGVRAFRWTEQAGMKSLGTFDDATNSVGLCVDGAGAAIGGFAQMTTQKQHAILWRESTGLVDVNTLLAAAGADLTGWELNEVRGISGDGAVMTGVAIHGEIQEAWIASIPGACGSADFDCDGDVGTDADIQAFFACLAGNCPRGSCTSTADINGDGDVGTDADIEAFFRVLAGGGC